MSWTCACSATYAAELGGARSPAQQLGARSATHAPGPRHACGQFPLANGLLAGRYDEQNLPKFPKSLTMKKYVVGGETSRGVTYPEGGAMPLARLLPSATAPPPHHHSLHPCAPRPL